MTLIKSISGIRGTIGGKTGDNLTPLDTVKFAAAYGTWLKQENGQEQITIVIGRDARLSGSMVSGLICNTLTGLGIDVIDLGLSTTPTVELAVVRENVQGGIIVTASHNPKQWNALKLLNHKGEFLNAEEGSKIIEFAEKDIFEFASVDELGSYTVNSNAINAHIDEVLALEHVAVDAIKAKGFKVVVDAVNSTGGIAIPALLDKLGVTCIPLYCEPTGHFPHNPEPLAEHLKAISERVIKEKADLGFVVDPDVDRLAIVNEDGSMFGEEYTLVACADYILGKNPGTTVSNLSSTRVLNDVTVEHGQHYYASAVGEVNVVTKMKEVNAVIGGEGNGGIIYPDSHFGRDALVGIALFLSHLAETGKSCKELRESYPAYYIAKEKIELPPATDIDSLLSQIQKVYANEEINTIDGTKIIFQNKEWVHMRKSNTEPIVRIYAESASPEKADELAQLMIKTISDLV
ncbi:phosphoglucosamine mutase [Leeuwenhoekiella aequorea]|uniref:Phosphomannomutase n=1 Tax=Leeuwenhoekiella aequorea TaxID=283736 RepID=A0A4Q0P5A2_9FLAO|nr:phosphoglucosamine mutase [Leeuwenhoekiella aequorea]RXG21206.1 phosphomannomutase [Leeuwenhoekiella aequorea]